MAEGKPITTEQLLEGLAGIANGLDETSDALRDYKRAINQSRALVSQLATANKHASAAVVKLTADLEAANKDRAEKAIKIAELEKALEESNTLMKKAQSEIERLLSEPVGVKA
jgi:chromosome segregation ATPase